MQTRKRSKSAAKKVAILAAATELFLEQGFESTSMDKVAQLAGVSKQTVYSHYTNKEVLFAAVIKAKCTEYGLGPDQFDARRSCRDNLLAFATQLTDMLSSASAVKMERLCSANAEERHDLALLFFHSGPAMIKATLHDYLEKQVSEGALEIDDVAVATSHFVQLAQPEIVSLSRWGLSELNQTDSAHYLQSSVDMFLHYYGSKQETG